MIFDWKNNKGRAFENGIVEREYFSVIEPTMIAEDGVVEGHTFLNFYSLTFEEGVVVRNCYFKNCGTIEFDTSKVSDCEFRNTKLIFTRDTEFANCKFKDIVAEGGMVISLENGRVKGCKFEDIVLKKGSYVCDGVGHPWIENCDFKRIKTYRKDGEIIYCEDTEGKIFKTTKVRNIVDKASCTGLELSPECITIISD